MKVKTGKVVQMPLDRRIWKNLQELKWEDDNEMTVLAYFLSHGLPTSDKHGHSVNLQQRIHKSIMGVLENIIEKSEGKFSSMSELKNRIIAAGIYSLIVYLGKEKFEHELRQLKAWSRVKGEKELTYKIEEIKTELVKDRKINKKKKKQLEKLIKEYEEEMEMLWDEDETDD